MKKIALWALLCFAPSAAFAGGAHGNFTKHHKSSFFEVTREGKFSIEMTVEGDALKVGANSAEIVVHDEHDDDVKGAVIAIEPWMPDMGHGVAEKPVVTEDEGFFGSRFQVSNLIISMRGRWELRVNVRLGDVADEAVFVFPKVGADGGGAMGGHTMGGGEAMGGHAAGGGHTMVGHAPAAKDMDLSRTRPSAEGRFMVSFEPEGEISLNHVHSWTVTVRTPGGDPVTGAAIEIGGDMPEHGHGLPTEPEVTEELGGGAYRVEGMKFSMPGWWIVTFDVTAGETADRASFNLMLK